MTSFLCMCVLVSTVHLLCVRARVLLVSQGRSGGKNAAVERNAGLISAAYLQVNWTCRRVMRPRKQGNNRTVEIPFHSAFQRSRGRGPLLGALMNPSRSFLGLSLLHKHKNMKRPVSGAREERARPSSGCPVLISVSILNAP